MKPFALIRGALAGWKADNCLSMGAALAFYSLLSMAPLLVLVISISGVLIGAERAQELLMTQLSGLLGTTGAEGVRSVLDAARTESEGIFQTIVSGIVLLVGATTVFGELQDDLDRIWKCEPRKGSGVVALLRQRLLSFGLIVAIGFLMLVSLVVSAAISFLGTWLGGGEELARALELAGSLLVLTFLFSLVFKILPSRHIAWADVLFGSFVTALLFSLGKYAIGLYIGKSAVASHFGAAGTLVVVIMWVYYSSQIFFFGAEITREHAQARGKAGAGTERRRKPRLADMNASYEELLARARRLTAGRGAPISTP
jgi:membrane protein